MTRRHRWVVVSGPSGVGKTTWAGVLSDHVGGRHLAEVVDECEMLNYANSPRPHGRSLRLLAQHSFLLRAARDELTASEKNSDCFLDHSSLEVVGIYSEVLAARGLLSADDLSVLRAIEAAVRTCAGVPSVVLLLTADPETITARRRQRARVNDTALAPQGVLDDLRARRRLWAATGVPVVELDTSTDDPREAGSPVVGQVWERLLGASDDVGHELSPSGATAHAET